MATVATRSFKSVAFRVPDRGSGNAPPLGGGCDAGLSYQHGTLQERKPHSLGLQIPLGVDDEVPLSGPEWRCWSSVSRAVA